MKLLYFLSALLILQFANAQPPRVLIVNAHPDDEITCSATVYKITHELKGIVDLALITNGEGGYKYSTLAESYYNLELTNEKVGRENLPRIRKQANGSHPIRSLKMQMVPSRCGQAFRVVSLDRYAMLKPWPPRA